MRSTANLLITTFHSLFLQPCSICEITKNIGAGYKKNALPGVGKTPSAYADYFLELYAIRLLIF
jgi:hypothetical protein